MTLNNLKGSMYHKTQSNSRAFYEQKHVLNDSEHLPIPADTFTNITDQNW